MTSNSLSALPAISPAEQAASIPPKAALIRHDCGIFHDTWTDKHLYAAW